MLLSLISRRRASTLARNKDGSVAIEFAALALPFAVLLFAILESCISFAAQQMLSNAAEDVARQLRTGQIKAATFSSAKLREEICDRMQLVVSDECPGLHVDLRQFTSFSQAATLRINYNGAGSDRELAASNYEFNPGPSLSKNRLRVFYEWPVMTDILRKSVSNLKGSKTLLYSTVTWQNEPFDD